MNYTAGYYATTDTISVNIPGGGTGVNLTKKFNVIEPSSEIATSTDISYSPGIQGAGMNLNVTVLPNTVSFANVWAKEIPGPASNVTGYFATYSGDLSHHPTAYFIALDNNNQWGDEAAISGFPSPWSSGGFTWIIPVQWEVIGTGQGNYLPNRTQQFNLIGTDGTTSITKLGCAVVRTH